MTAWTPDELTRIGSTEEVQIASLRRDGTTRKPVTVWVVPHDDSLYVRSVDGRNAAWFRGVLAHIAAAAIIAQTLITIDPQYPTTDSQTKKELDAARRELLADAPPAKPPPSSAIRRT